RPDLLHGDRLHRGRPHGGEGPAWRLHPRRGPARSRRGADAEPGRPHRRVLRGSDGQRHVEDLRHASRTDLFRGRLTMSKRTVRITFALLAVAYVLTHFLGHAHAQSSLGIGTNEATFPSTGLFSGFLTRINTQQQAFYRSLTGAL